MGPLGDHDDDIQSVESDSTLDGGDDETQPIDSQYSPSSMPGKKSKGRDFHEIHFLQNTLPFVDTVPVEDEFETQVVDEFETQVMDEFETQVMNLAGETQVWDDPYHLQNMETQLLDDCYNDVNIDGEGSDGTEILDDTEEACDDDSVKGVDQENTHFTTTRTQDARGSKAEFDGLVNEQCHSEIGVSMARLSNKGTPEVKPESERRDFTTVRVEALRASGLAAGSLAGRGTNNERLSIKGDSQSSKQHSDGDNVTASLSSGKEFERDNASGKFDDQTNRSTSENNCRIGRSSTARRLFMDDKLAETGGSNNNTENADGGAALSQLPPCDSEMAGLSYVDSQEPGELSQANALDFVNRFLKSNATDHDGEVGIRRSTGGKSKPDSSAKGTHNLARRINLQSSAGERGIYDWDDSREDEGGGEFLTKRKEALVDIGGQKQRSNMQPRKLWHLDSKGTEAVDGAREVEKILEIHQNVKGLVNSDPTLLFHTSKRTDRTSEVTKASIRDLAKEVVEQLERSSSDGTEPTGSDKDLPERFDTQMAAEAMEELCFGTDVADHDNKDNNQVIKNICEGSSRREKTNKAESKKDFLQKRSGTQNSKKAKSTGTNLSRDSTVSSWKQANNVRKRCGSELMKAELKKAKSNTEGSFHANRNKKRSSKRNQLDRDDRCASSSGCISAKKRHLQEQLGNFTPIALRTRRHRITNQLRDGIAACDSGEGTHQTQASALGDRRQECCPDGNVSTILNNKEKISELDSCHSGELEMVKLPGKHESDKVAAVQNCEWSHRRARTHRKLSGQLKGTGNPYQVVGQEPNGHSLRKSNRLRTKTLSHSMDLGTKRKTRSSACTGSGLPSSEGSLFQQSVDKGDAVVISNPIHGNVISKDMAGAIASKCSDKKSNVKTMSAVEGGGGNARFEASPGDRHKPSGSASTTPINCSTSLSTASPICMGDEYLKQSCRKNLSGSFLLKDINSLISTGPSPTSIAKDSRRRREMASVRVLFSRHLDDNIIKQQKKILVRLGASIAPSISEATHFITDKFVRTRNMLEFIAFGKPVVTHLWLESCGQASCFIDERNYILRDAKKEKEFGFSLPVSLGRACQRPLLQGQKVLITPNTKPGREILASLVKAVHGRAVERIGRSALKDDKIPDDLIVLSCEEDYALCMPFLEKGAEVYSSELLLNGIVIQKLEYERHRLFVDHIKRTRSTIWLKQDSNKYRPVKKCK